MGPSRNDYHWRGVNGWRRLSLRIPYRVEAHEAGVEACRDGLPTSRRSLMDRQPVLRLTVMLEGTPATSVTREVSRKGLALRSRTFLCRTCSMAPWSVKPVAWISQN
jgi:hypothetical protein